MGRLVFEVDSPPLLLIIHLAGQLVVRVDSPPLILIIILAEWLVVLVDSPPLFHFITGETVMPQDQHNINFNN